MTLLRAVLVLALMLNGTALPPVAAMDDAPGAASHAGHQGMDHPSDQAPADDPAESFTTDCCDGKACDCGCAGPQVISLPVVTTPRAWATEQALFTLANTPFVASLIAAPFRPPA